MKYIRLVVIALVMSFGLMGCKTMEHFNQLVVQPKLSVASFSMAEASLVRQVFKVKFEVENPNLFALPLLGMQYDLNIADVDILKGTLDKKVTIPAGGRKTIELDLNTNLLESLPN